ncbi:pyridoxamine 5'-phosphate oxidase family protein [Nisaea acidiphila]|uniref:Pyridoxamine 5'-phosphate oxidase family protein n=1 Tax=Nisaea acidiphila TaxID=1862145 RepID=A0A9J7ARM3_9PROT|nr:pyridoxamine 5'-phosphate oxidase family protein [Nisaea acidiphila]UUX49854.1 pyridoxamine 5'-phosphate oxidase family protein [Nisaea acidiphila]
MSGNFAQISFTPAVREAQTRYGSRAAYSRLDGAATEATSLSSNEAAFITERDGFYQATVSETGWPYVQYRGGPAGFLKVLDERTIGYADFRGNRQYLSVGNMNGNDRVSLILMDYANRRRLKIWARARIVHRDEAPDLVAKLEMPDYRARVERAIVLTVEAFDWNCPQHIEPRFTEADIKARVRPLEERICHLELMLSGRTDGVCEC